MSESEKLYVAFWKTTNEDERQQILKQIGDIPRKVW